MKWEDWETAKVTHQFQLSHVYQRRESYQGDRPQLKAKADEYLIYRKLMQLCCIYVHIAIFSTNPTQLWSLNQL